MPSYNFATKASPKVQEAFYKESITEGIFSNDYDWTGVATVRIYSVDDLPMQDYDWDKTDGSRFGTLTELGDTVQELTVNRDRSFNGSIDKRNNTSELMIKAAGKVLARQCQIAHDFCELVRRIFCCLEGVTHAPRAVLKTCTQFLER